MNRVVVTGLGMVTPLAAGVEPTWRRLLAGESGAARVESFDVSDIACQIAAQVPRGAAPDAFNPDEWMEPKEQRKVDDFIVFALAAAGQALRDADWAPKTYEDQVDTGVLIGSGIGGLGGIYEASVTLHEKGPRRISPFFIPGRLINLAGGQVSIAHGLKGPNHAVVTACSTGAHAIGDAGRLIALGDAKVMVAGGAEFGGQPPGARRLRRLPGAVDRVSTIGRSRPRAPMTATATASSWARAPAASCSRTTSTPRRAARASTPSSSATACRATPITSLRPRPTATAPIAR